MTPPPASPARPAPDAKKRTEQILAAFHDEERFTKGFDKRLVGQIWTFLKPHRRLMGLAVVVLLFTSALSLMRPLVMMRGIDDAVMKGDRSALVEIGLLFAGMLLAEQIFGFVHMYVMQVVGARAMAGLRRHVFQFLHGRRLAFFPAVREHWPDVGGMVPGSMSGKATEIYQEGVRIPPVKIMTGGRLNEAALDILLANMRVPDERLGDFHAGIAACRVAETRIREEGARTSILYTSGYADDALTGQHGRDERIHFLAKPYTGTTLLRKIREVLDTKTSAAGGSAG